MGNLWNVGFEAAFKAELLVDPWDANTEVLGRYLSKLQDGYFFEKCQWFPGPPTGRVWALRIYLSESLRNFYMDTEWYRQIGQCLADRFQGFHLSLPDCRRNMQETQKDNLSRGWRIRMPWNKLQCNKVLALAELFRTLLLQYWHFVGTHWVFTGTHACLATLDKLIFKHRRNPWILHRFT
jgi:hypothetical protein